ncbi:hypothetical protein [Dyella sp.]|uniref:hypothetical protein n=1 Tax=Dyella sp. TaxID=1869338 RepID=UPI002B4A073C|nr:hypothetical protein [Dyella sp.]HKT29233.1 hypothetical protein [Dyella sp.]
MKVIWTQEAELDREDVLDLIALDNAAAAIRMDELFSNVVARADTCRLRKAVKEKRSIQLWTKRTERRVVEPHRVEAFSLPGDALFEATRKKKVWIVVKTETAGTIKRRGRKFWSIASDYAALVEIATRGGEGGGFPM